MHLSNDWVERVNAFSIKAMSEPAHENALLSPLGLLWSALPLLGLLSQTGHSNNAFARPDAIWGESGEYTRRELAGALLVREGAFADGTLERLAEQYGLTMMHVDFSSDRTAERLNKLIYDQTHGMIPGIAGSFPALTVAALASALYASDAFVEPFDVALTQSGCFNGFSGTQNVLFMRKREALIAEYPGFQAALLPLRGGGGLCVYLPESAKQEEPFLSFDGMPDRLEWKRREGELLLPRFTLRCGGDYANLIHGMNIPEMPSGALAAYGDLRLQLNAVLHEAVLEVDECGIRASAATMVELTGATPGEDAEPFSMICDRPFGVLVFDRNEEWKACSLFVGRVADIGTAGENPSPVVTAGAPAAGNPKKSLFAPFDGMVLSLMGTGTAMQVACGQPLLLIRSGGNDHLLCAPANGLVVYMPAKEGMPFVRGEALIWMI